VAALLKILGNGIYAYPEAARLTGVHTQTVRAWFLGRKKHGEPIGGGAVFNSEYGDDPAISFLDLIEVLVAGQLRNAGVSLSVIRKSFLAISKHLSTLHPFSREELVTDGKNIFLHTAVDAQADLLVELFRKQHFFHKVMKPYLSRVSYDKGTKLARSWQIMDGVVVDPRRSLGKPVVDAAGIPASILAKAFFANGQDSAKVADWYGVAVEDVEIATRFSGEFLRAVG
jgi:uncharacterized protein (DUF433 family)